MNWTTLFDRQRELDERIKEEHQLSGNQFDERLLALLVELGELANETRSFKFWSTKGPSPQDVILEEYVDGIHFLLSLGLALGYERDSFPTGSSYLDATDAFLDVFRKVTNFGLSKTEPMYETLMAAYLELGYTLGINEELMVMAYMAKNEKNHERQNQGY
ncbi:MULTISPECIES: dUTP diphosphatase [Exiguobacterium]|uniref:dUTP diphosphatase n=1 Tax=Exiguobacterium aurantiacum TaxID=33987 RepID=A0ABY5FQZ2_9BACL|nr:dUTP diphosphatase [Exiguobacterium aurantiacum]UTT44037.1 dUTP diphosphatase [Exiguobacterium aurantiacum]